MSLEPPSAVSYTIGVWRDQDPLCFLEHNLKRTTKITKVQMKKKNEVSTVFEILTNNNFTLQN